MSQRIPPESFEYERYVDGLRTVNKRLVAALSSFIEWCEQPNQGLGIRRTVDTDHDSGLFQAYKAALKACGKPVQDIAPSPRGKIITIHIEGGLVQDVTGIPPGYELRVEDYDVQDPGDDSWDAAKECVVTVYEGGPA